MKGFFFLLIKIILLFDFVFHSLLRVLLLWYSEIAGKEETHAGKDREGCVYSLLARKEGSHPGETQDPPVQRCAFSLGCGHSSARFSKADHMPSIYTTLVITREQISQSCLLQKLLSHNQLNLAASWSSASPAASLGEEALVCPAAFPSLPRSQHFRFPPPTATTLWQLAFCCTLPSSSAPHGNYVRRTCWYLHPAPSLSSHDANTCVEEGLGAFGRADFLFLKNKVIRSLFFKGRETEKRNTESFHPQAHTHNHLYWQQRTQSGCPTQVVGNLD